MALAAGCASACSANCCSAYRCAHTTNHRADCAVGYIAALKLNSGFGCSCMALDETEAESLAKAVVLAKAGAVAWAVTMAEALATTVAGSGRSC